MNPAELRREYSRATFDEASAAADPFDQFRAWFDEAVAADVLEPNAMTLATADASGRPSARIVLLKGFDANGFVFYTDYRSRKARELGSNPHAALVFRWAELERQVRVTGIVATVDTATSQAYFRTRPIGSQVGAWASHQSAVLPDRATLEANRDRIAAEYAGRAIPLPPHWGGFLLHPDELEFWQGRPDRLHDRIAYRRAAGAWQRFRLSP